VNGGERRALLHYLLRGYRPVGWNVRAGRYELDLIVRRGRRIVFCEVKEKRGTRYGDPLAMVDEEKLRRVHLAAETWLAANPRYRSLDVRVEAIGVAGRRLRRVNAA
jgi:putative endonuclease